VRHETTSALAKGVTVSFPDLHSLASSLTHLAQGCADAGADAARLALDPRLLTTAPLSPLTAARVATSLSEARRQAAAVGSAARSLGSGADAAAWAYRAIDGALESAVRGLAHTLSGAGDVTRTGAVAVDHALRTGGQSLIDVTLAQLAARSITATLAPIVGAAGVVTYYQNIAQSYRSVLSNPFSTQSYTGLRDVWANAGKEFLGHAVRGAQAMPDALYAQTLRELPFLLRRLGARERVQVRDRSVVDASELVRRGEAYRDKNLMTTERPVTRPRDAGDLAHAAGYVDALGAKDQAVIRVIRTTDHPPAFTVVVPSTKDWSIASRTPNDLRGNLNIMTGDSALLRATDEALRKAMSAAGVAHPASTKVMVVGFSQGGITAAAFAKTFQHSYRVEQVVTIGAPIGRFSDIPARTKVLAYEFEDDLVPEVDHARNPDKESWETIRVPGGKHDAATYARAAHAHPPRKANHLDVFLDRGATQVTDYYALRPR